MFGLSQVEGRSAADEGVPKAGLQSEVTGTSPAVVSPVPQELVEGKSLAQLVRDGWRGSEAEVKQIAEQLLETLSYIGSRRPPVTHRSVLLSQGLFFQLHTGPVHPAAQCSALGTSKCHMSDIPCTQHFCCKCQHQILLSKPQTEQKVERMLPRGHVSCTPARLKPMLQVATNRFCTHAGTSSRKTSLWRAAAPAAEYSLSTLVASRHATPSRFPMPQPDKVVCCTCSTKQHQLAPEQRQPVVLDCMRMRCN